MLDETKITLNTQQQQQTGEITRSKQMVPLSTNHRLADKVALTCKQQVSLSKQHLLSSSPPLPPTFKSRRRLKLSYSPNHRTHKQFEYRWLLFNITTCHQLMVLLLSAILCAQSLISPAQSLDSPVKVQRYKQQQQKQQQQLTSSQQQVGANREEQALKPSVAAAAAAQQVSNGTRIDRVRRTDEIPFLLISSSGRNQDECPANRLIQSLLPAEYAASGGQQRNQRAFCDCTGDLSGWHLTCFAGSANRPISVAGSGNLPNQLHPAFRAPQLQRQQAAAAAASALRRLKRSGSHLLLEEENARDELEVSSSASAAHDGFGEELTTAKPSPPNRQQQQTLPVRRVGAQQVAEDRSNVSSVDHEALISLPSSASFSLMQLDQHRDNVDRDPLQQQEAGNEKLTMQMESVATGSSSSINSASTASTAATSSNSDSHLMFQTVPVLFNVKYMRNSMIEIDCDQAAPQYRPALFQGFNVNEISSFTFNNCQLPNIPFSVLLHRTRMANSAGAAAASAAATSDQLMKQPVASNQQLLKPSRLKHQNLVRKRRQVPTGTRRRQVRRSEALAESPVAFLLSPMDDEMLTRNSEGVSSADQTPAASTSGGRHEPRVKSLTINLQTVVDQRTLVSLLTGLDYLEELQLNYMQLNLTAFEPDLEADSATGGGGGDETTAHQANQMSSGALQAATSGGQQQQQATGTNNQVLDTSSSTVLRFQTSSPAPPVQQQVSSTNQQQVSPPQTGGARLVPPTTSTASPPTTSTTSTTTTTTSTTAAPATQLLSAGAGSTTPATPTTRNSQPTLVTMATPTTTTTAAVTTTTAASGTRVKPFKTVSSSSSSSSRSSIQMGAPRGLMTAQATGLPVNFPTTTPTPAATTVPSVSLATVAMATQSHNTAARGSGVAASVQPPPPPPPSMATPTTTTMLRTQSAAHHGISLGPASQSAPITYAGGAGTRSISSSSSSAFQTLSTPPATPTSSAPPSSRQPPSTGGWIQAGGANTPPAGMRLSTQPAMLLLNAGDQTSANPWTLSPSPSPSPSLSPQLSAPLNNYGIRTSPSAPVPVSLPAISAGARTSGLMSAAAATTNVGLRGLSSSSSTSISRTVAAASTNTNNPTGTTSTSQHPQTRRQNPQTTPTTTLTTNSAAEPTFVAAGGRLQQHQQLHPNTRRQFPTATPISPRSFADEGDDVAAATDVAATATAFSTPPDDSFESSRRVRRNAISVEEFELSFGELLPNLRSLKLESFIDLSHLITLTNNNKQVKPRNQHLRFKRQFQAQDVPERDEGHMSESEADAIENAGDTMLAEESSFHHNMVMANAPNEQRTLPVQPTSLRRGDLDVAETADHSADGWTIRGDHLDESSSSSSSSSSSLATEQPLSKPMLRHLSHLLGKMFSRLNKLKHLQLTSNDIPHWPDNVLIDSRNSLTRLYLISNNIRSLGRNSLANLTELETLDLSSNQLRQLNSDLFRDLTSLRNLRAVRNLFRKLPGRLFSRSSGAAGNKLINVDFSKNRYLSQLAADVFLPAQQQQQQQHVLHSSLLPVTSLNLSDCVFNDQLAGKSPELLFASLPDLSSISLKHNKLREFLTTNGLFAKNNRLTKLDISHNQLNGLSANLFNANASQITDLQLHHNQLSQIPDQFLFSLRKLRRLSLSHNKLSQLNARMFFTNQLIESIDLSHNQLITLNTQQSGMIPFGNGANLRSLNLAYNNLSQFESDIFDIAWSFYTSLSQLDLSHNHFEAQIAMPIFYTIADELQLNLASNRIQSISVEALMQHEQVLDRYATYEASESQSNVPGSQNTKQQTTTAASKLPTVSIRLTGNPITCDCMLEPLISYSRRVAAITNPSLVASIFNGKSSSSSSSAQDGSAPVSGGQHLPANSRYSVLEHNNNNNQALPATGNGEDQQRLPQLFYQFKFNDLYCAQPINLQRRLLGHISIGDLLCPIKDQRLCPQQCQCHYQSAFRTAIVDCNNRQLEEIPEQLTEASNFVRFQVESAFAGAHGQVANSTRAVSGVDKVIIRLDNNRLRSMEQLGRLFSAISGNKSGVDGSGDTGELSAEASNADRARYARAPPPAAAATPPVAAQAKKVLSPVLAGKNNLRNRARSKRRVLMDELNGNGDMSNQASSEFDLAVGTTLNTPFNSDATPVVGLSGGSAMSTAVLESAEEFRNKRYPLACELYLDHNLIESLPGNFLEMLDQIPLSSMQSTLTSPQSALPTLMLEPPVHTKLEHLPGSGAAAAAAAENRIGSSTTTASSVSDSDGADASLHSNRLFGASNAPLSAQKKAALMETIQNNVRINQQRPLKSEPKVSVSPALAVLSLRYNNLSNIQARILQRLGKLIRSSNTKLYLGHNPFNCSDNYALNNQSADNQQVQSASPALIPASVLGDQLIAASDSISGAYLESTTDDDLSGSASSLEGTSAHLSGGGGATTTNQQLSPVDCPVGQLKSWLTGHHASVGDLDEIYCVHMPPELAEKLRLAANVTAEALPPSERLKQPVSNQQVATSNNKWDHDHPWASSLMMSPLAGTGGLNGSSRLTSWNSELLLASAKLIDANMYDLCPYSGIQMLDASTSGLLSAAHQQVLVSVAIIFILISLCLLLMLVYFGDTQTILAFVYIHLNPIYKCLRLNESHLDGEKLYDAFVSYSSADRDIVMELIERLEQTDALSSASRPPGYGATAERTQRSQNKGAIKGESDVMTGGNRSSSSSTSGTNNNPISDGQNNSSTTLSRRTSSSFQDLSTMSRSTSRIMMGTDDYASSALDVSSNNTLKDQSSTAQQQVPYRLCIHERDWLPGHLISWNIVNSVQNSRRTILILSKDFIKSVWFQVEFHTAYYQMLEDKIDRLIVIVRGELPPKNELDKNLAFLLTTKTYLTWGEKWFWERLHYALPHRAAPPAIPTAVRVSKQQQHQHHHHQSHQQQNQLQQQQQRHHFAPAKAINGQAQQTGKGGLSGSHNSQHSEDQRQKPLIMSDIGKECANLLLPVHQAHHHHQPPAMIGSSSSSGSSNSNTRSSSSFLSGSSTGNLLSPTTATTHNDLLSTSTPVAGSNQATTRLTIGPETGGSKLQQSSANQLNAPVSPTVTSIMVDAGNAAGGGGVIGSSSSGSGSNSKLRAKKQERLQSFVDKSISDHFNLSEL